MSEAPLSDRPTIAVSMRCLRCGGSGREPSRPPSARLGAAGASAPCMKCAGDGKVEERVTLTRLASLLANPGSAERDLFGDFAP